ncbi:hypothetical protein J7W08_06885 [Methanococcoides orientis]|uniref:hypothetical protein n=1 Tax=Methanococcoides orientis TaxID=2822137 RepID=UPI001E369ADB|nr:hypothetical protein [Methanococcoides orientis]UGV39853.1 hypothetical protein J7W08_06885 [Methanococcoides orientis]
MTTTKPLNYGSFHPSLVNPYQRYGFLKKIGILIFKLICTSVNTNHHHYRERKLFNQFKKEDKTDKEVG